MVLAGKDKGRQGAVLKVMPKRQPRRGGRPEHGSAPHPPVADPIRRAASRTRKPSIHLSNVGRRGLEGQADPRRLQDRGRQEGPYRQDDGRGDQWLIKLTNRGSRLSTARASVAVLKEKFGYTNEMQIPKLEKIVINMGDGRSCRPTPRRSTRRWLTWRRSPARSRWPPRPATSIAGFKLREGMT